VCTSASRALSLSSSALRSGEFEAVRPRVLDPEARLLRRLRDCFERRVVDRIRNDLAARATGEPLIALERPSRQTGPCKIHLEVRSERKILR
jgi:hypothetical protein